ncbi:unnamed protein product [Urochloa decumbens]|uniref:Uncharacterized protein n=1 Tax=Urochloa decumbens TaxID=240449 RepID=A0ABC9DJ72_9POAL
MLCTTAEALVEVVQSSKQIKIQGLSLMDAFADAEVFTSGRWKVAGYDWEVRVLPNKFINNYNLHGVALRLYFRSDEVPTANNVVKANFSCRLIDPSGKLKPFEGISLTSDFKHSGDSCYLGAIKTRRDLQTSGYLQDDALTVECTLKVLKKLHNKETTTHRPADDLVPSSGLNHHLGELLQKGTGADITLVVSGESFTAHKAILASRSPVFMAEFFGHMKEKCSPRVEIKDMEVAVFRAMLHFIYTDSAPELDLPEDGTAIAQHLLVAADRYGIDRLKLICEDKLYDGISVDTAATTLALAEQHGCSHLELIILIIEAVMVSCPSAMNDLLKAVHGRKN